METRSSSELHEFMTPSENLTICFLSWEDSDVSTVDEFENSPRPVNFSGGVLKSLTMLFGNFAACFLSIVSENESIADALDEE